MADTNLAQAVEAANDFSSYDTNIKLLLADKQILARILKYAVQEFKEMLTLMRSILDVCASTLTKKTLWNNLRSIKGKVLFNMKE